MMLKRIGANTLRYLLTLLVASLVIFIALRVIPGNPAEVALGVTATDESVAKLSATMGIDKPLWQQYVTWVQGLVTGNLGMSLTSGADISPLVFDRLQVSIILVGCSMVMALGLSIPLGVWAARRARKWDGVAITVLRSASPSPAAWRPSSWWPGSRCGSNGCRPTVGPCPAKTLGGSWPGWCSR